MLIILNQIFLIPWNEFEPSMSFFVPCLDGRKHAKTLKIEAERRGYKIICKQVVENGKFGLRVWRV